MKRNGSLDLKKNEILYYLSASYDTSKSGDEFQVVNCLCSREIVNKSVYLRWDEERNVMNESNS